MVIGAVRIGEWTAQFYVDFSPDSAVLGFRVDTAAGPRYFPVYASTYRGLPPVTIEVVADSTGRDVWVRSSWSGYEVLAYHRPGTDRCLTRYGEIRSHAEPTPARLAGPAGQFPEVDAPQRARIGLFTWPR